MNAAIDRVSGLDCSTKKVYEEGAKEVALSVVSGVNCMDELEPLFSLFAFVYLSRTSYLFSFPLYFFCTATIFAYGQTSIGKTYTMSGIIEYTIVDIYDYIEKVSTNNVNKMV